MYKMSELREKEVINMNNGSRIGIINDMVIETKSGMVKKLIIPGPGRILGFIGKSEDLQISWNNIETIGDDVILVRLVDEKQNENK